jgi:YafQ family addiction module toxin component
MLGFGFSDELKLKVRKLLKKDRKKVEIIHKKVKDIVKCSPDEIMHYKNLRHDMKDLKRVHIDAHFVLTFRVDVKNNFVLFVDFDHHDNIY